MPKNSKPKEGVVILIDVGENVSEPDVDGKTFLDKSKQCASRIIKRKIFSDSSDEYSIILIGSEKTKNELNYPNIREEHVRLTLPRWEMLKCIENLSPSCVTSDWLSGLVVAINRLKDETEVKKFTDLKIILFSNFATRIQSIDQADEVIESLKSLKIELIVIGLEINDNEDDENSEEQFKKTKVQRKGEAVIGRIVEEIEGITCGFDEAMLMVDYSQKFIGRAQPWYCDLQIGNDIHIPISGYKKIAPKSFLKWGKRGVGNVRVIQETVHFQGDDQVDKPDVISSYLFGQTVVPISGDDKTSLKLTTEKCFQLIGFTNKKNVPRHMLLGDSGHCITPRNQVEGAIEAITALVKALLELEMVGIVRKVYCKNSAPRTGALIPICEEDSYFFYYVPLPFAEDERNTRLPPLNVQPSKEQLDAVDKLIDAMDLSLDEDELDNKLIDPVLEHTNNLIIFKAMNPDAPLPPELPERIMKLLKPRADIIENASDSLESIKQLFPLKELEQKNYKRGAADVFDRSTVNGTTEADDIQPENLPVSISSFVQSTITEIGTIDPKGNFLKLLESGERFEKICEQMQTAIKKLLLASSSAVGVEKPLSALQLLRQHSVMKCPSMYNDFVAALKDDLAEKESEFWNLIVQDKLGLITSEETEASGVSPEEAEIFYSMKKSEPQSEISCEMEVEDMLDMI